MIFENLSKVISITFSLFNRWELYATITFVFVAIIILRSIALPKQKKKKKKFIPKIESKKEVKSEAKQENDDSFRREE